MTSGDRGTLLTLLVVAAGLFVYDRATAPADGLPPAVSAVVDRHAASIVRDTAADHRLEREKAEARRRERAATAARRRADSLAAVEKGRADSLAAVAQSAQTSADSAKAWQAAYDARGREAAQLAVSRDSAIAEAREARVQLAQTTAQLATWRERALRADTVIAQLLPLAEQGDSCRIARVVRCPSRTQVLIGTVIGALVVARK